MVSTAIHVVGPKKLIRPLYKKAKKEHRTGSPFMGLFEHVSVAKVDGHHELTLRRFGYLPLSDAKRQLTEIIDRIAEEKGIDEAEREEVRLSAEPNAFGLGL